MQGVVSDCWCMQVVCLHSPDDVLSRFAAAGIIRLMLTVSILVLDIGLYSQGHHRTDFLNLGV